MQPPEHRQAGSRGVVQQPFHGVRLVDQTRDKAHAAQHRTGHVARTAQQRRADGKTPVRQSGPVPRWKRSRASSQGLASRSASSSSHRTGRSLADRSRRPPPGNWPPRPRPGSPESPPTKGCPNRPSRHRRSRRPRPGAPDKATRSPSAKGLKRTSAGSSRCPRRHGRRAAGKLLRGIVAADPKPHQGTLHRPALQECLMPGDQLFEAFVAHRHRFLMVPDHS